MSERTRYFGMLAICGVLVAAVAVVLAFAGNPKNMAICIACFLRDTAGGMNLHAAAPVQYVRPEIIGIILGATCMAFVGKEFKPSAGSSPILRFILGFIMMVGCLIFLGCPLRMVLRMGGGDLNAWVGLIGFVAGIAAGVLFLKKGFSLGAASPSKPVEGAAFPALFLVIGLIALFTTVFTASAEGPGSMHAAIGISLVGGLVFGAVAQKSRLCFAGGLRDTFMVRDAAGLIVVGILFAGILVYNLATGNFNLGFADQPIAHSEALWNILGLFVVGFAATLLGGCPLRQLVLAGSGSSDSAMTVFGLIVGAAFCHNFGWASSAAGTTFAGQIACVVCIAALFAIAVLNLRRAKA